jgi:hypothetical protein
MGERVIYTFKSKCAEGHEHSITQGVSGWRSQLARGKVDVHCVRCGSSYDLSGEQMGSITQELDGPADSPAAGIST